MIGLFDRAGLPNFYSRTQSIFGEGEPAEYLYKIQFGCIRTYITLNDGRRQIGSFYFPGDVIGLGANKEHSVSAEAVTRCNVFVTERKSVLSHAGEGNLVLRQLLELTNFELQRTQSHIVLLLKTAQERVIGFLLEMEKRQHAHGAVESPLSRRDIADNLGLTIETVSRVF